jgi:hypothetical protein
MTGVDGYPAFCDCGTFAKLFAPTFKIIKALPGFSSIPQTKIFVAETDLAPLGSPGYESMDGFISDLCAAGGDGVLQFQDGTPALTSSQWTSLSAALKAHCGSSPGPSPTATATTPASTPAPTPTMTTPAPTPTVTTPSPSPTPTHHRHHHGGHAVTTAVTLVHGMSAHAWHILHCKHVKHIKHLIWLHNLYAG